MTGKNKDGKETGFLSRHLMTAEEEEELDDYEFVELEPVPEVCILKYIVLLALIVIQFWLFVCF